MIGLQTITWFNISVMQLNIDIINILFFGVLQLVFIVKGDSHLDSD